jgi:hypothetical protein
MVSMLKRRFLVGVIVLLSMALVLPTTALAYNWYRSPESPLVPGGVHSKAEFKHVFLYHKRVSSAVKGVLAADHAPSWVYGAAVTQVRAGRIYSSSLPRGTKVGAMAFGPHTTKIIKGTVWKGSSRLPYFYVNATQSVVTNGIRVTTTYKVALAKTCGNPFVLGPFVTRTRVAVPTYNLYIEKRYGSMQGRRLNNWAVTGTVGGVAVDKLTSDEGLVLVGTFPAGAKIDLQEIMPDGGGWIVDSPPDGHYTGLMPAADLTITFINHES